jgi:alkylation response protein AidB-like acyl-CoA dehydrogenase
MEIDDAVAGARAAAELIAPLLGDIDTARRLPAPAIDALVRAGIFKLCVPRSLGGAQASPLALLATIEELARLDGSVGWCTMIGATSGLMSVYLDDAVAREIYAPADAITCGVFAPMGRASRTETGYRISGRWAFASGCEHSRWRMGGTIADGDAPLASGAPDVRSALFRAEDTTVHDTWDTVGLRGTGSHDFSVEDVEVPRERTFSLLTDRPRHAGYELPFFGVLAAGVAAVGLGIARASIESATHLVQTKKPPGSKKTLAHRELVQLEIARAEARTAAARGLLRSTLETAMQVMVATAHDDPRCIAARARLRLAACHAATESAAVVAAMYELGGGSAVYAKSPLARQFRDAQVVPHHLMVSSTALTMAGRALLGVEVDGAML